MKAILVGIGEFIKEDFDKLCLLGILVAGLCFTEDRAHLSADVVKESLAALLGFMQSRRPSPPAPPK